MVVAGTNSRGPNHPLGRPSWRGQIIYYLRSGGVRQYGSPWPDGSDCDRGSVLIISAEDDPHDTIRPRLDAHFADCTRIHLLSMVRRPSKEGTAQEVLFTLANVAALEDAVRALPDLRLIVIDPIGSYIGTVDSHRDEEVRSVLMPVAKIAEKYGPAVLVVAHRRKGTGDNADDLAMGSRAFTAIARSVWHVSRDPKDHARRLLLAGKQSLGPELDGLAFRIIGEPIASVQWEKDPVRMTANEGIAAEQDGNGPGRPPTERDQAAQWLRKELSDFQEDKVEELQRAAKEAGIAWRTVQRARADMEVIVERSRWDRHVYIWRLQKPGDQPKQRKE